WSCFQKMLYVADTDEQARADLEAPLAQIRRIGRQGYPADQLQNGKPDARGVSPDDPDAYLRGAAIYGSPETVACEIARYADNGLPTLACWFQFGCMQPELTRRSIQRFVDEVMPRFRVSRPSVDPDLAAVSS